MKALVVGDLQAGIVSSFPFSGVVLGPLADVLPSARAHGVLVVFIQTALRTNRTDLAPGNALMTAFFDAGEVFHEQSPTIEIADELEVQDGDVVIRKRRASAFHATDLDLVLRAHGVTDLVLTGVATSAMVAATLYDASDLDYRVTVLADACADPDPGTHDFFVDTVFPARGATVTDTRTWAASLADPATTTTS